MKKLINNIILNGTKKTSENVWLKLIKKLQKFSKKNVKKLIKLCLISSISVFKINILKQNKKIVRVIKKLRVFLAIKFIINNIKTRKFTCFYKKFYKEIVLILKNDSSVIKIKNKLQKEIFLKKHLFLYYRWR